MRTNSIAFAGAIYPMKKGEDIDLMFSPSGNAWITFKVATYGGKNSDGEKADKIYHKCLAFRETAEAIAETFTPGDQVMVFGTMQSDNWTNREGVKMYGTKVMVNEIGATLRYQQVTVEAFDRPASAPADQPARKATPVDDMEAPF